MKVYGVHYRDIKNDDFIIKVFADKEKAKKLFEKIKRTFITYAKKYHYTDNITTDGGIVYLYINCDDDYYEGQTYFVQMKEFNL